jgi:L-ascorbate metabolism protein UlaG (beta-lactamase superfamily)
MAKRSDGKRFGRRAALAGVGGLGLAGLLEFESLRGSWDHRRPLVASGREVFRASLSRSSKDNAGIVHVGHSTHLLCFGSDHLLTDPWFHDPAFGALAHEHGPAVGPNELGELRGLLITHDHPDHADARAMDAMDKRAKVVTATQALATRVKRLGFTDVNVLQPWEEIRVGGVRVTAVPALHDCYEIGFVCAGSGTSVYFAGDTRLHPDLARIREQLAPRFGILPVDGTRLMSDVPSTMTPADAVKAAQLLGLEAAMPSHAEAKLTDPLAKHALAHVIPHAAQAFAEQMQAERARCWVPAPGEWVPLAQKG